VRIALSGSHAVGKSTLIADLHQELPAYKMVDEPYYQLLDEGHIFADRPSVEDLLTQLERSIAQLTSDRAADVLYDRCPADFLAYLSAFKAHDSVGEWITPATDALRTLDLIVFVPIEQPDRIADVAAADSLRRNVDTHIREMLLDDSFGFDRPVIEVQGSPVARAREVLSKIQESGSRDSLARGLTRS
jgi:predicted ATPase